MSRYEFARAIVQAANRREDILSIITENKPDGACRPLNSVLDCSSIRNEWN